MNLKKADIVKAIVVLAILAILLSIYRLNLKNRDQEDLIIDSFSSSIETNQVKSEDKDDQTDDMKVHITGQIKNPGVYEIEQSDRLIDLIDKAGGLTNKADDQKINLAMKLEDQMKIVIPSIDDSNDEIDEQYIINDKEENNENSKNQKININTADIDQLQKLPNIGEKRAEAIIDYRKDNKFENIEDIKNVSGIGDKYFDAMKDMITTK
ncbi:MAG: DUF655 domain-containing protein [Tissierellia bacterium]|nr:DUF655 domain-containing protein [Tissierellia bacterium]